MDSYSIVLCMKMELAKTYMYSSGAYCTIFIADYKW